MLIMTFMMSLYLRCAGSISGSLKLQLANTAWLPWPAMAAVINWQCWLDDSSSDVPGQPGLTASACALVDVKLSL